MRDLCEPLNKVHSVSTMIKIDFVSIRIQLIKVKPEPWKADRREVEGNWMLSGAWRFIIVSWLLLKEHKQRWSDMFYEESRNRKT